MVASSSPTGMKSAQPGRPGRSRRARRSARSTRVTAASTIRAEHRFQPQAAAHRDDRLEQAAHPVPGVPQPSAAGLWQLGQQVIELQLRQDQVRLKLIPPAAPFSPAGTIRAYWLGVTMAMWPSLCHLITYGGAPSGPRTRMTRPVRLSGPGTTSVSPTFARIAPAWPRPAAAAPADWPD